MTDTATIAPHPPTIWQLYVAHPETHAPVFAIRGDGRLFVHGAEVETGEEARDALTVFGGWLATHVPSLDPFASQRQALALVQRRLAEALATIARLEQELDAKMARIEAAQKE